MKNTNSKLLLGVAIGAITIAPIVPIMQVSAAEDEGFQDQ